MADESVDVLIVGAGLSGIGAASHLRRLCPGRSVAILEARHALGGTWDLFRYPGIRSDSDMYTLGYSFRPWTGTQSIADGPSILQYLQETAREQGIERLIRFGHRVQRASWSSDEAHWTVDVKRDSGEVASMRCAFLLVCGGYYDYAEGYTPDFPGRERFAGRIVHPQQWTSDIDHVGKRVVVIGSGATAVTLVPELAKQADHVTMLQRSPSYVLSVPSVDRMAGWLLRHMGPSTAHGLTRWRNVMLAIGLYALCRGKPRFARDTMLKLVRRQVGPDFDVDTHFTPTYNPWEQRLCFVPDGDLFKAIREQRVSVVTDRIESFTETGLKLASGAELAADLVVTATGLKLKLIGGVELSLDGRRLQSSELVNYKGVMFTGVPNFASIFGYTNASWTLKADLASLYVCRLLNHMERTGVRQCVPHSDEESMPLQPWVDFSSGYFQRAMDQLPKQGLKKPWKLNQNYLADLMTLRYGAVDDGVLRFKP